MSQFEYLQLNRRLVGMEKLLKGYEEDKYYTEGKGMETLKRHKEKIEEIKAKILLSKEKQDAQNT